MNPASGSRSQNGCVPAFGVLLIVIGLAGGAAMFGGPAILGALVAALPFAARWWPVVLIVYGILRLTGRFGSERPGCVEILLLALFIALGVSLSVVHRAVGGELGVFREWIERREASFPGRAHRHEVPIPVFPEANRLILRLPWGGIRVRSVPAGEVRLVLDARAWREAEAPATWPRVMAASRGDGIEVGIEAPEGWEAGLHLTVEAPPRLALEVETGEGGIRVEGPFPAVIAHGGAGPVDILGVRGAVSVESNGDAIFVRDIEGPVQLRGEDAAIEVETVEGPVGVEVKDGSVRIEAVRGEVRVDAREAPVRVAGIAGPVRIRTTDSPVTLARINGDATVEGDGDVLASRVAGTLEASLNESPVVVLNSGGRVRILGNHALVRTAGITGPLEIRTWEAPVLATDLAGGASIRGGESDISIREVAGPLAVTTADGDLDIATGTVDARMALFSEAGDIRLAVPGRAVFRLSATSGEGRPRSDFPLTDAGGTWSLLDEAGGPELELTAPAGGIRITSVPETPE